MSGRPAVFLDRDGTLSEERGFIDRLELLEIFPWTSDAIRLLNRAGFAVVVVTNQSAVGRGIIDLAFLQSVHDVIDRHLAKGGAKVDRYYYCPHHPDAPLPEYRMVCRCRKPGPGMIEQAAADLGLDLSQSFMVGDRPIDVACGHAGGVRSILVRSGHSSGGVEAPPGLSEPDAILNNLMEAVGWILRSSSPSSAR
ncbi:MAG TPA: HAD family hydrolase [Vicinamibacterales bacterium]|nr:HAD family hydrolase [Vicinamibacterales bacterium]